MAKPQLKRFSATIGLSWYASRKEDLAKLKEAGLRSSVAFNDKADADEYVAKALNEAGVIMRVIPCY
jgi:hypothetical protein